MAFAEIYQKRWIMDKKTAKDLSVKAIDLRKTVLEMIRKSGGGHIGGDFSVMETLVVLYNDVMNISPENKDDPDRDYFIMSKGHSVESYYAVLADRGFFDTKELVDSFSQFGSKFIGHPNNEIDGVEMNSGSLGHGLPVSVGMALGLRMDKSPSRVYTVMGDGELAEGSVWEGFMAAGHYKLGNLCAVVDRNHLQISGTTEEVMTHENLHRQVEDFGWNVLEVNGNSIEELSDAFCLAKGVTDMPTLIIANTIKGFGGGEIMENNVSWHHHVPDNEEYEKIIAALDNRKEALINE